MADTDRKATPTDDPNTQTSMGSLVAMMLVLAAMVIFLLIIAVP